MIIESAQNDNFRRLLSLTSAKGLKEEGLLLLSGDKLIREFLKKPHLKIVYEAMAPTHAPLTSATPIRLAADLFDQVDMLGTHYNILVLEQPPCPVMTAEEMTAYRPGGIELVVPVGDPGNLGALIRSCEAFAVPKAILTREAAHPFLPKCIKASAGSVLRVPMLRGPALAEVPEACIALDAQGTDIDDFAWPARGLLVVGEEGPGFGGRLFANRIRIPTAGVESLNVVVAASIALSRIPRRRGN